MNGRRLCVRLYARMCITVMGYLAVVTWSVEIDTGDKGRDKQTRYYEVSRDISRYREISRVIERQYFRWPRLNTYRRQG